MLKCQSELFQPSLKLVDGLKMSTKEELKRMAKILLLPVPTKLRKDEYVTYFAEAVLTCPEMWLSRLTHYELVLLDKLVKAGSGSYVECKNSFLETTLETLSFIATDCNHMDESKVRYMICDELREAVAPYLSKLLTSKKQSVRFMIEQYACGIVNLYGFLSYSDLLYILVGYLQHSATREEIADSLANSALIQRLTFEVEDGYNINLYIESPFLDDFESLEEQLCLRRDIPDRKKFSKEEAFSAGTMPLSIIPNPCLDELKEYMMKKLQYTEEKADSSLSYMWYVAQTVENPMPIINSMINRQLSSMQELQEAIEIFMDYLNHSPRWLLKGYSSEEAFVLFEKEKLKNNPPRIVAGPNMKAAGMEVTPEMQAMVDNMFRTVPTGHTVGRNDPCPCGSGKKYKKCCGRNN
nr:SEC-C metal-binding domain-containing protein [Bacteroides sp.]